MTSTNKAKLSKGQRESRTRKETGRQAEGSRGRAEWLVIGAKLSFWDCLPSGERKGAEGNCPRLHEQFPAAVGQGSPEGSRSVWAGFGKGRPRATDPLGSPRAKLSWSQPPHITALSYLACPRRAQEYLQFTKFSKRPHPHPGPRLQRWGWRARNTASLSHSGLWNLPQHRGAGDHNLLLREEAKVGISNDKARDTAQQTESTRDYHYLR